MIDSLRALGDAGGRPVAVEIRHAHGDLSRLPALAAELVAMRPDVLYTHTTAGAVAAAKATSTIPIVVGPAGEQVLSRLAGNLARPVGNVTGLTIAAGVDQLDSKCLQLLKALAPRVTRVALILNPDHPDFARIQSALSAATRQLGQTVVTVEARGAPDLPAAFAAIAAARAEAIYMVNDALLAGSPEVRRQVGAWALSRRLPLASSESSFVADGALIALGTDTAAIARRAAVYVHRILGGARPGDLPVERPTLFKLSLNGRTAKALGLAIPQALLLQAAEVID